MTVPPHLLMPLANRQASEPHEVHESVPLYGSALDSKVSALDSIVLDFDRHGRLIGLEIIGSAPKVLPAYLVAQARRDAGVGPTN